MPNHDNGVDQRRTVHIQIWDEVEDPERTEQTMLSVRRDLLELASIADVEFASNTPDKYAKAAISNEVGVLLVTMSASVGAVRSLAEYFRNWLKRNADKHVRLENDGRVLDLTGLSDSSMERTIQRWYEEP